MPHRPPAEPGMREEEVDTPALLLDLDAFEHNLDRMAALLEPTGARLRAHAKTHKSPVIARLQMARGAVGQCVQKVAEAEILAWGGVPDILVSNEVVGARKLARLAALSRIARVAVCADDPAQVAAYEAAAQAAGLRAEADLRNEKINYKVREHSLAKIPALLVVGKKEAETHSVSVRRLGSERQTVMPTDEAIAALLAHDWPGNVRELRNLAERTVLGLEETDPEADPGGAGTCRLPDRVAAFERSLIAGAIAAHGGRLRAVYESLGISRKTLYEKMQKYGLDRRLIVEPAEDRDA